MELLRRIGSLGLIGLLFAAVVPPASAQEEDDDFSRGSLGLLRVTGPDSRSFLQDLRLARQAIGEERYDDALSYLGRLLTADPSKATDDNPVMLEDYFLVKENGDLLTSIKTEALRLLDSIPSKALKQYELAHGAEAQFARGLRPLQQEFMKHPGVDGQKIPGARGDDSASGNDLTRVRARDSPRADHALAPTVPDLPLPGAGGEKLEVRAVGVECPLGVLQRADFYTQKVPTTMNRDDLAIIPGVRPLGSRVRVQFVDGHETYCFMRPPRAEPR